MTDDLGAFRYQHVSEAAIPDIAAIERNILRDVLLTPGRQIVDNRDVVPSVTQHLGNVRTDEPSSTCHKHSHHNVPFG
jgi:hypothetical protein